MRAGPPITQLHMAVLYSGQLDWEAFGMYDMLIKNGFVFDGTGSVPYTADVAAVNGDIVAIGLLDGPATKTVEAGGLAVSPGFIDLHTHSDMSFLLDPTAQSKVRQGVTLELAGNCLLVGDHTRL